MSATKSCPHLSYVGGTNLPDGSVRDARCDTCGKFLSAEEYRQIGLRMIRSSHAAARADAQGQPEVAAAIRGVDTIIRERWMLEAQREKLNARIEELDKKQAEIEPLMEKVGLVGEVLADWVKGDASKAFARLGVESNPFSAPQLPGYAPAPMLALPGTTPMPPMRPMLSLVANTEAAPAPAQPLSGLAALAAFQGTARPAAPAANGGPVVDGKYVVVPASALPPAAPAFAAGAVIDKAPPTQGFVELPADFDLRNLDRPRTG